MLGSTMIRSIEELIQPANMAGGAQGKYFSTGPISASGEEIFYGWSPEV